MFRVESLASLMKFEYQRTLANGYDSFKPPNDIQEGNLLAQWGHRYVLNLRPHEHYTRYYHPIEGGGPRTFRPVRGNQDVDSSGSIRANGLWRYSPDLRDPATRALIYSDSGVTWTKDGVRPLQGTGLVVFKVNAANVVTSAKISLSAIGAAVSVSRDAGINWHKLAADSGQAQCLEEVAGVEEYLVKVELSGTNALLSSIVIETITQLNRPALARLIRGPNRIQVRLGAQVETTQLQPSIIGGNHKKTIYFENYGPKACKLGYSDEEDVGAGAKPPWIRYRWGKNLALGRPYTIVGAQDERNPDGGGDLTDGIIAPPDTYVSVKYMPTYVMFAPDVSPAITIDLGSEQTVSAVRVHAGQEGGFHLSYPDVIKVETSVEGSSFAVAGSARFNQVFDPPADYVPWELDLADSFINLPAGGRLADAYRALFEKPVLARYVRVTCQCRKGWGMLLSELQVFDRVTRDGNAPPLVVLPPIHRPNR